MEEGVGLRSARFAAASTSDSSLSESPQGNGVKAVLPSANAAPHPLGRPSRTMTDCISSCPLASSVSKLKSPAIS